MQCTLGEEELGGIDAGTGTLSMVERELDQKIFLKGFEGGLGPTGLGGIVVTFFPLISKIIRLVFRRVNNMLISGLFIVLTLTDRDLLSPVHPCSREEEEEVNSKFLVSAPLSTC